jgi:hypothetical protein
MLLPSAAQKQACKEKICASQIGQLLNNSLAPIGAFSGGLIGPCCPPFTQADLKKPADSAEGAAARIKADTAGAKARVAAVKYLATVDCGYWPEAADALVNALRADRNECVRFAAAEALRSGCCCGKKTIVALSIAAAGSDRDGNPAEKSERVKITAQAALEHCLARCGCAIPVPTAPVEEKPRERPAETPIKPVSGTEPSVNQKVEPAAFYKKVETLPDSQVLGFVRQSVMTWSVPASQVTAQAEAGVPVGTRTPSMGADHSLLGIMASAFGPAKDSLAPPGHKPRPVAVTEVQVAQASPTSVPVTSAPPAIQTVGYQYPKTSPWPATSASPYTTPVRTASTAASPSVFSTKTATPAEATHHFPPANGVNVGHLLNILRDSDQAQQRAWAASELACVDGTANPDVVNALVAAAQIDTSPGVRVQCIRTLAAMHAHTPAVMQMLESLKKDKDATVEQEAIRCHRQLAAE